MKPWVLCVLESPEPIRAPPTEAKIHSNLPITYHLYTKQQETNQWVRLIFLPRGQNVLQPVLFWLCNVPWDCQAELTVVWFCLRCICLLPQVSDELHCKFAKTYLEVKEEWWLWAQECFRHMVWAALERSLRAKLDGAHCFINKLPLSRNHRRCQSWKCLDFNWGADQDGQG